MDKGVFWNPMKVGFTFHHRIEMWMWIKERDIVGSSELQFLHPLCVFTVKLTTPLDYMSHMKAPVSQLTFLSISCSEAYWNTRISLPSSAAPRTWDRT